MKEVSDGGCVPLYIQTFRHLGAFPGCGCVVMANPLSLWHTPGKNCLSLQKKKLLQLGSVPGSWTIPVSPFGNDHMLDGSVVPPPLLHFSTRSISVPDFTLTFSMLPYGEVKENVIQAGVKNGSASRPHYTSFQTRLVTDARRPAELSPAAWSAFKSDLWWNDMLFPLRPPLKHNLA